MLLVNYKTYKESSGENSTKLAEQIDKVSQEYDIELVSCPQNVDAKEVLQVSPNHSVWAQHVDPEERGRATGWFPPEIAREIGFEGTLLNHSEHKLSVGVLGETLAKCRENGLKSLVFADSIDEAKVVAKLDPDWIGYEPPELVGSKETSVSRAKPEIIEKMVEAIPKIPVLVGAGVKDKEDVEVAMSLGARGVGVASAVVLVDNPIEVLKGLADGFN